MKYCTKCGGRLVLKHQGKINYSRNIPRLPFYTVNVYECENNPWWQPWPFTNHDHEERAETTEIYKIEKAKWDKTHELPLPNPGTIIRKGL